MANDIFYLFIGVIQILSVIASIVSIVLNVIMANGFGNELDLKLTDLIFLRAKCVPMVFISMIFRCVSFVMMATLFRAYAVVPIIWIWWITHNTAEKIIYKNSFFFNFCTRDTDDLLGILMNAFQKFGSMLVGPVVYPIEQFYLYKENISTEAKKKHDKLRKKLWLFDGLSTLLSHGIVLIIIIVLWETTSIVDQNLSICAFPIIKDNISIICGSIIILGALNCLMSFLYYKF